MDTLRRQAITKTGWKRLAALAVAVAALAGCGMSEHEKTTRAVKDLTGATDADIAATCGALEGTLPEAVLEGPDHVRGRLLGIATAIEQLEPGKERTLAYCAAFTPR